jgi:diguanylate cyclase (GGDEF)-like protein/PAS domain S-box-containing protein
LQTRAAIVIALGIIAVSGFVALSIANDTAIAANYQKAAQIRQLQADNLTYLYGMVDQQSGIRGYTNTADPSYLLSYKSGRERASSVRERLRAEARAADLGPAIDTTLRFEADWQVWAEARKSVVDQTGRPQVDPIQAAKGNDLFEEMRSADEPIAETAEASVSTALSQAATRLALEYTVLTTGGVVAMVSLTLLLFYFVAGVLRPVARLARVAQQLAEDDDVRVPVINSGGEVGELTRALAAWQYSSAERLALTQLAAESESRFRLLFDRAPVGIARLARNGRIVETNPALHQMLGFSAEELAGLNISELFRPDERVAGDGYLSGLGSQVQEHLQEERLLVKKDGNPFWGDVSVSAVHGGGGEFQYFVAMFEDITDRKRQAEALEHRALHDPLTDLPNRTLLFDRLHQAVLAAKREHQTMALLIMDLDGFKEINDTYGHHAGDVVLKQVAKRVRSRLRDSDTVARLGGDEFAFVLAGDDQTGGAEAAARLMRALAPPFTVKGKRLGVGASIGVAVFPQDGVYPDTLVRKADEAMYRAKRSGGGYALSRTADPAAGPPRARVSRT